MDAKPHQGGRNEKPTPPRAPESGGESDQPGLNRDAAASGFIAALQMLRGRSRPAQLGPAMQGHVATILPSFLNGGQMVIIDGLDPTYPVVGEPITVSFT